MSGPDAANARLLFEMAVKDLKALRAMLDPEAFDDEIFGFHCHQAVEKALKAWISLAGLEYRGVHDLGELFSILEDGGGVVAERFLELVELNAFAVQHRYLPFEGGLGGAERGRLLAGVRDLLEHVRDLVAEPRPGKGRSG